MLQAIAGFYAYFTVLHGFGFKPGHLIGLDQHRVFNEQRKEENLRDAYYLWCFDTDITAECIYLPNLYAGESQVTLVDRGVDYEVPWYTQPEFFEWQRNNKEFAKEAKQYLVKIAGQMDPVMNLTMANLEDGTADTLTWEQFEDNYWRSNNTKFE